MSKVTVFTIVLLLLTVSSYGLYFLSDGHLNTSEGIESFFDENDGTGDNDGNENNNEEFDSIINIGFINPQTGPLEDSAHGFTFGAEEAIKDLNEMYAGWGYTFQLVEVDSGCNGEVAASSAQDLVAYGVWATGGAACSGASKGANTVLSSADIPMISYASSDPSLSDVSQYPDFFRIVPSDAMQGYAAADMMANMNVISPVILYNQGDYTGSGIADAFEEAWGTDNVCQKIDTFHPGDYYSEITQIADADCDAIFITSFIDDLESIFEEIAILELDVMLFSVGGEATIDEFIMSLEVENALDGVYVSERRTGTSHGDFEERYDIQPFIGIKEFALTSYDSIMILGHAAFNFHNAECETKIDCIFAIGNNYEGASGLHTFLENGDVGGPGFDICYFSASDTWDQSYECNHYWTLEDGIHTLVEDDDGDGVMNNVDLCPLTPSGKTVDTNGCHGGVVTWGSSSVGGDSSSVSSDLSSDVIEIYSTDYAFAALKSDGSVVTWGASDSGGDSSSVSSDLSSGVVQIFSSHWAFAALKSDGSVVTWGALSAGGDSGSVTSDLSSGVTQIFSSSGAFAALKSDGSVVTWGNSSYGGDSSSVSSNLSSNVIEIYSTDYAFAALKSDGSVVTWGPSSYGGDSGSVSSNLTSNVTKIFSNPAAFAALKSDGSVVTWGNSERGGDSTLASSSLGSNVIEVFSTADAFAALKSDGSVVTWGYTNVGGDSSSVSSDWNTNITNIYSTFWAFAALKSDGSVVTLGDSAAGGDSSSVSSDLASNVTNIYSTNHAFAALKSDGSVVTWGNSSLGGDSSSVSSDLSSDVIEIYSSQYAFAALKSDGSVVTWGSSSEGGDSSSVRSDLNTGRSVTKIFSARAAFAAIME